MSLRVLHLVDDSVTDCDLSLLDTGRKPAVELAILCFGSQAVAGRIARLDLPVMMKRTGDLDPVLTFPYLVSGSIEPFNIIHCWSVSCAVLAVLKHKRGSEVKPVVLTLTRTVSDREIGLIRVLCQANPRMTVLCHSDTLRGQLLRKGVSQACVYLLRPGLRFGDLQRSQAKTLRESWAEMPPILGSGSVPPPDDDHHVVGVLCDKPSQLSKLAIGSLLVVLLRYLLSEHQKGHPNLSVILPAPKRNDRRYQDQLSVLKRNLSSMHLLAEKHVPAPGRLAIVLESRMDRPWEVLPGMDAVIYWNQGQSLSSVARDAADGDFQNDPEVKKGAGHCAAASGLSLLWAMAAQVPVAGQMSYELCEWMEDRKSAFLVPVGADWKLAQAARQALGVKDAMAGIDNRESWKRADQARSDAFNYLSASRYSEDLHRVYGQLLNGEKVEVPQVMGKPAMMFGH